MTIKDYVLRIGSYLVFAALISLAVYTRITGGDINAMVVLGATFGMLVIGRDVMDLVLNPSRYTRRK